MAVLSDYAVGTISIAVNGVVATGTGTAWNLQSFQEGDTLLVNNLTAVLSGPATSATSIPLTRPWTGGALTNVPYRIRYMSDGSRYTAIAQALVNLLSDGTVAAVAAAGSAVDKLTYWSGAGVAALTDLTAFARTNILNKTDRAGLLTGIGVSENVTASARVATDLNNEVLDGWVSAASGTTTNIPAGLDFMLVQIVAYSGTTSILQTCWYIAPGARRQFARSRILGVWSSWVEQVSNTLLGTVSQASGIATGAIIERASNANGEYVRFTDGTQLCTHQGQLNGSGLFAWTFPVAFAGNTQAIAINNNGSAAYFGGWSDSNDANVNLRLFSVSGATVPGAFFRCSAIGRWL